MQTTEEHTRRLLQDTAREALLGKGFKTVFMREISGLSGVGLSSIHNYYPCKDDLLTIVLRPLLEAMTNMLENHNSDERLSLEIFTSKEYYRQYMQEVMGVITRYRKELRLLFLDTRGTRFEDFWERWIDKSMITRIEHLEGIKELYPGLHTNVSPFFIHFISSWWISMMKEIVLHEKLSSEDTGCFIGEYIHFSIGGWKRLMEVDHQSVLWTLHIVLATKGIRFWRGR